jgi:hypothetical protein
MIRDFKVQIEFKVAPAGDWSLPQLSELDIMASQAVKTGPVKIWGISPGTLLFFSANTGAAPRVKGLNCLNLSKPGPPI